MNDQSTNDAHRETDEMRAEYDFSAGERGKHHRAFHHGYRVVIHKKDGSVEERDCGLPDGAIMLDPDLRDFFPDSDTVNRTLRGLLQLIPERPAPR
jgi:hypothetical protein